MAKITSVVPLWNLLLNLSEWWKLLTLSVLMLIFVRYSLWRRHFSRNIPGRKCHFFDPRGNIYDIPFKTKARNGYPVLAYIIPFVESYSRLFKKHKLYNIWFTYHPMIVLNKAESVEVVLSGTKMIEKSLFYSFLHPVLGTGLLTSKGNKWKSRRKLLTPAFHSDILKEFIPVINPQAQLLVKKLRKEVEKDFTDIVSPISLCSLDIICETTLGVKIGAQENSESEYLKAFARASATIIDRCLRIWLWPDFIFALSGLGRTFKKDLNVLHEFTRSIIHKKKQKLLSGDSNEVPTRKRKALMDLLLEHHIQTKDFTEEDIREEVDTFTNEGHDTTAMAMVWALYLIGLHKKVQNKMHEELDVIFGEDAKRDVTTEDMSDMKYLDCVLKESQRLYPSVPIFQRHLNEDMDICGYPIPKGATVGVFTYGLHRDEEVFPDPEKFDPDRFLPENSINRSPYAYAPFSAGPRNCIGQRYAMMEMKVVLSTVLRNYSFESLDHRDKVPVISAVTLRPAVPIRVRIRPRTR